MIMIKRSRLTMLLREKEGTKYKTIIENINDIARDIINEDRETLLCG